MCLRLRLLKRSQRAPASSFFTASDSVKLASSVNVCGDDEVDGALVSAGHPIRCSYWVSALIVSPCAVVIVVTVIAARFVPLGDLAG